GSAGDVKGCRRGAGLDDQEDEAPHGDERHQEQATQHAEAKTLSREGSALRVGIAQALTLGTARADAVLVRTEADEKIAVRKRDSPEIQPGADGRPPPFNGPLGGP